MAVNALVRHDARIVAVNLRELGRSWTALLGFALTLCLALAWTTDQLLKLPQARVHVFVIAAACVSALLLDGALRKRLIFFAEESPLAADALRLRSATIYRIVCHSIPLAALAFAAGLAGWSLVPWVAAGYALGLAVREIVARTSAGLPMRDRAVATLARSLLAGRMRRSTAIAVTAVAIPFVLATLVIGPTVEARVAAGMATFAVLALLSPISHPLVSFQRVAGYGLLDAFRSNLDAFGWAARALLLASLLTFDLLQIAVVAAVCMLVVAYRAIQLMVYRVFSPRKSEMTLFALLWVVLLVGGTAPFLLPVVVAAIFIWVARRAQALVWLLQ